MEKQITRNINIKDFRKTYIEDICGVLGIHSKLEKSLIELIWLSSHTTVDQMLDMSKPQFNDDINKNFSVLMTKELKQQWANKLQVSLSSINNTLTKLITKNAVNKTNEFRTYILNVMYFPEYWIDLNKTSFTINYKFI